MKKLFSFFLVLATVLFLSVPCFAEEISTQSALPSHTVTENLGNGPTVEIKTTVYNTCAALKLSSVRSATKTKTYKENGTVVATVTLNATFEYNGSSAWVTGKSAGHSTVSGWSYSDESFKTGGTTARLSATLTHWFAVIPMRKINADVSLTCSPSGIIS